MKIIKRDFKTEEFEVGKIITSIKNTAKDCHYSLNQSDINYIRRATEKNIKEFVEKTNDRYISSLEVKLILFRTLKECNFHRIAKVYIET